MDKNNSNQTPEPHDELWLRDVETLKVFADERRLAMLKLLKTPQTVKALAASLDIPASKLYYHMNLLEKHKLIIVVDQHSEGNLLEKVYQAAAKQFKLVNPLVSSDLSDHSAIAILSSMLEASKQDFLRAYQARDPAEGTPPRHPFFSKKSFCLTDEQLTAFHARLDQLIQDVTALAEPTSKEDKDVYSLSLIFFKQDEAG